MGICCTTARYEQSSAYLKARLLESIEHNQYRKLSNLYKYMKLLQRASPTDYFNLDDPIKHTKDVTSIQMTFNALGYALWCGSKDCFVELHEKLGASLKAMTSLILKSGKTPMAVICERGHLSLLKYYLPIFLKKRSFQDTSPSTFFSGADEELSIFMNKSQTSRTLEKKTIMNTLTPIMLAVERNHINIVSYLVNYFDNAPRPREFDVNFADEILGENCALIAVKSGNIDMVQFLYQEAGADFTIENKRNENAVQVAAAWSKKKPHKNYLQIIDYLIEMVEVDITSKYEEILLVCDNSAIVRYLEKKLQTLGIHINKRDIERKNQIISPPREKTDQEARLDMIGSTPDFYFMPLFHEFELEEADKYSDISSIAPAHNRTITPISISYNLDLTDEMNV